MTKILKDDEVLAEFDEEQEKIDLSVLTPYIGEQIEHHLDGEYMGTRIIESVEPHEYPGGVQGHILDWSDPI